MSKSYEIEVYGHPSIYSNDVCERKLKIYFNEPENGANNDTGMVLFIPGFGASSNSNVYKKMRSEFSDKYNLITVQCDYFGQKFMQGSKNVRFKSNLNNLLEMIKKDEYDYINRDNQFNINKFLDIMGNYETTIEFQEVLNENIYNFNDMGVMQALDNVTALLIVKSILEDNNINFNQGKIIAFGQSHGAYLTYLCNAIAPNLFSLVIDNSAWLFPEYLSSHRYLISSKDKLTIITLFEYFAKENNIFDKEILDLNILYNKFHNNCNIVSYHGVNDNLISCKDKKNFCMNIDNCEYNEIDNNKIDGKVFRSTSHGLDADFINLFDSVMKKNIQFKHKKLELNNVRYTTKKAIYNFEYTQGIPMLDLKKL